MCFISSSSYLAISLVDGALFGSEIFPQPFCSRWVVWCFVWCRRYLLLLVMLLLLLRESTTAMHSSRFTRLSLFICILKSCHVFCFRIYIELLFGQIDVWSCCISIYLSLVERYLAFLDNYYVNLEIHLVVLGFWLYWNLLLYSLTYSHLISTHHIHIHSLSHLSIVLLWCSVRFFGGYNSANKNKSNFHHQLNFHPSHKLLLLISLFPNLARFLFGFRFCPLAIYIFFFISCSSISLVSNWRVRFCRSFVFFFFFQICICALLNVNKSHNLVHRLSGFG